MMKIRVTKKSVKENYKNIIAVGYCDMYYLLRNYKPFGYSCSNSYGWACDYYDVDGVCISTGYSPIGSITNETINIINYYENKASKLATNCTKYDKIIEKTNILLNQCIKEILDCINR